MKKTRKYISALLAVLMLLSVLSMNAVALPAEDDTCGVGCCVEADGGDVQADAEHVCEFMATGVTQVICPIFGGVQYAAKMTCWKGCGAFFYECYACRNPHWP